MWSRCSRRQPLFLPLTQTSRLFSALFADFSAKLNSTHTTLIYTFRSGNISESNQHIKVISVHCTVTNKMKNPRTISAYDTKQPDNSVSSNIPCLSSYPLTWQPLHTWGKRYWKVSSLDLFNRIIPYAAGVSSTYTSIFHTSTHSFKKPMTRADGGVWWEVQVLFASPLTHTDITAWARFPAGSTWTRKLSCWLLADEKADLEG